MKKETVTTTETSSLVFRRVVVCMSVLLCLRGSCLVVVSVVVKLSISLFC
jgi:hypothetical protein